MVKDSSGDFVAELDIVFRMDHVNAPNFLNRLRRIKVGVSKTLKDNESLVFMNKVLGLV